MTQDQWKTLRQPPQVPEKFEPQIKAQDILRIAAANTDLISKVTADDIITYITTKYRAVSTLYSHKDCDGEVYWTSQRDDKHSEFELTMYDVKRLEMPKVEMHEIMAYLTRQAEDSPYAKTLVERIQAAGVDTKASV